MKILLLPRAPLNSKAGIPVFCKNLIAHSDHQFIVLSILLKDYPVPLPLNSHNCHETICSASLQLANVSFSLKFLLLFFSLSRNCDVIHVQDPDPIAAFCCFFLSPPGKPIITTWHCPVLGKSIFIRALVYCLSILLFLRSSSITFFTKEHKDLFSLYYPKLFLSKSRILPYGYSTTSASSTALSSSHKLSSFLEDKVFSIATIGRLVPYKDHHTLIRAFSLLDFPSILIIIGQGPLYDSLQRYALELGVSSRVFILTNVSDDEKHYLLSSSNVFCLSSNTSAEAFGIVQLEAMSHSLPLISPYLNNPVNSLSRQYENSLHFYPQNYITLAKAISLLYYHKSLYDTLSHNSASILYNNFSTSSMTTIYNALLSEV
jgi:glycosyltransferase involved in cell wall biosynthesis